MPTATFIQTGDTIDYTAVTDLAAGAVVVIGELVGVTRTAIKAGQRGAIAVAGVFDFPKPTGAGTASGVGINIYWDEAESVAKANAEAGANKLIGKSVAAATDDDTLVRVRLTQ
jgi:predicted RecA/RadA family phage recombinase